MSTDQAWADLAGSLPTHQDEVMAAAHEGQPSPEVQDRTHGAGSPAVDLGTDDQAKYC
ncbi:MAG TPA: hypothetical protein VGI05_13845 [Streptosporangiaceae bacterium]